MCILLLQETDIATITLDSAANDKWYNCGISALSLINSMKTSEAQSHSRISEFVFYYNKDSEFCFSAVCNQNKAGIELKLSNFTDRNYQAVSLLTIEEYSNAKIMIEAS